MTRLRRPSKHVTPGGLKPNGSKGLISLDQAFSREMRLMYSHTLVNALLASLVFTFVLF